MQKYENLADLENPEKMSIWLLAQLSIQPGTSLSKFEGDWGQTQTLNYNKKFELVSAAQYFIGALHVRYFTGLVLGCIDMGRDFIDNHRYEKRGCRPRHFELLPRLFQLLLQCGAFELGELRILHERVRLRPVF